MSLDHAVRTYRNLIAILIVVLILGLMLILGGCSTIKMERQVGADYEKITVRAPPKDFTALDFLWHETRLRAGEAATSEQPWADVAGDIPALLLRMRDYCTTNPGWGYCQP